MIFINDNFVKIPTLLFIYLQLCFSKHLVLVFVLMKFLLIYLNTLFIFQIFKELLLDLHLETI